MRKVTRETATAFLNGEYKTVGNTTAYPDSVYLHGNLIAERVARDNGVFLRVTLAGWNTPTTRERVNGILETFGIPHRIGQRNFDPCIYSSVDNKPVYIASDEWLEFKL